MILCISLMITVIGRLCLEDDVKRICWVIRLHFFAKNRWSCTSIEIVLIKVRSMVYDVLYIVIRIDATKAWGFNLFWSFWWTWIWFGEGFAWCCEWILHLKIILDIIVKHMHIFMKSQVFKHKYFSSIEFYIYVILIWTWNWKF